MSFTYMLDVAHEEPLPSPPPLPPPPPPGAPPSYLIEHIKFNSSCIAEDLCRMEHQPPCEATSLQALFISISRDLDWAGLGWAGLHMGRLPFNCQVSLLMS